MLTKKCIICGKIFEKPANYGMPEWTNKRKYCSVKCADKDKIGNIPWNKGIKTGIVPKTAFKKGQRVSIKTEFKKGQSSWNKGKSGKEYLSSEARKKMGKYWRGKTGKDSPNWKGGVTENLKERYRYYRQKPGYKLKHRLHQSKRRALINTTDDGTVTKENIEGLLVKQNYKCRCGIELKEYHIDHKTPPKRGGKHTIKNIQLLCPKCNILKADHLENNLST